MRPINEIGSVTYGLNGTTGKEYSGQETAQTFTASYNGLALANAPFFQAATAEAGHDHVLSTTNPATNSNTAEGAGIGIDCQPARRR